LRNGPRACNWVRSREAGEAGHVVTGHGVVVAGFGIALVGGEEELVAGGVVPGFAEGEMAELGDGVAGRVGDEAVGEVVLVVILGAGGIDLGEERAAGINIFAGG